MPPRLTTRDILHELVAVAHDDVIEFNSTARDWLIAHGLAFDPPKRRDVAEPWSHLSKTGTTIHNELIAFTRKLLDGLNDAGQLRPVTTEEVTHAFDVMSQAIGDTEEYGKTQGQQEQGNNRSNYRSCSGSRTKKAEGSSGEG